MLKLVKIVLIGNEQNIGKNQSLEVQPFSNRVKRMSKTSIVAISTTLVSSTLIGLENINGMSICLVVMACDTLFNVILTGMSFADAGLWF